MAFPILALLAAGASDLQQRSDYRDQVAQEARQAPLRIMQAYASRMGGQPYSQMQADSENRLSALKTHADASRNNNIGALLQAYLAQKPDKDSTGLGNPDASLASGWGDDPWGAGGY